MLLSSAIAAVFGLSSLINTAADAVGTVIDRSVIAESASNMADTAFLLKEKALKETDPTKKAIKLKMAEKLSNSSKKIFSDASSGQKSGLTKVLFSSGKSALGEISSGIAADYIEKAAVKELGHYGAYMASKTIATPVAIMDGVLENIVAAKKLLIASKFNEGKAFSNLTDSSDLDTEIEKIKAEKLRKDTEKLNRELEEMKRFYDERDTEDAKKDPIPNNDPTNDEVLTDPYLDDTSALDGLDTGEELPIGGNDASSVPSYVEDPDYDPFENLPYMPSPIPASSYDNRPDEELNNTNSNYQGSGSKVLDGLDVDL
ncbi:MAG: hypothetical protein RBS56_04225 [Candidatus Gracilibacteria bacterium]|jgi:hypothetical protein|nr:hypothetical protein [Candidatus Gracilibacteria bacterium]